MTRNTAARGSHRKCSLRKGVLKNFAKFAKTTCARVSFLTKLQVWPATLLKETLAQVFSCEFYEISKNTFSTEHLWATASVLHIFSCNSRKTIRFHFKRNKYYKSIIVIYLSGIMVIIENWKIGIRYLIIFSSFIFLFLIFLTQSKRYSQPPIKSLQDFMKTNGLLRSWSYLQ